MTGDKMKKRYLILVFIILASVAMTSCTDTLSDPFIEFDYEREVEEVKAYPVQLRDFDIYDTIFGKSVPKSKVSQQYEDVTGYFLEYKVGLLDEVEAGDVVAVLDSSQLDKELRDQKILYDKSKLKYEKALMEYNSSGQGENAKLSAKLDFDYEKYRYDKLLDQYASLELKAEISGTITKRHVDPGDFIKENMRIFDITDDSEIFVSFDSKDATGLVVGETLEIEIRNSDELVSAEIIEINGDEIVLLPEVIHSSYARTGTLVYIRILKDKRIDALVIEDNSIVSEAGRHYVYVYEDGLKSERDIKIGIEDAGFVEVLFGLEEGELVVSNPH